MSINYFYRLFIASNRLNMAGLKKISSPLITILVVIITLELSPYLIGSFFLGNTFSRNDLQNEIDKEFVQESIQGENNQSKEGYLSGHEVHPYLGFIHSPNGYFNDYGFPGPEPVLKKTDSTINVCITGGSVAKQLYQQSADELIDGLKKIPEFSGKKIQLVCTALGGFKQPQQLLTVNYLLSLGTHFDIVINLDGFNEVVLPYADNLPFQIHPTFPRHWNVYSKKVLDPDILFYKGKNTFIQEKQIRKQQFMKSSILKRSNFVLFIWKITDNEYTLQLSENENKIREILSKNQQSHQTSGPTYSVIADEDYFTELADYWVRCSKQIHALENSSDLKYYHFLQPNQYLPDSKPLTDQELDIAFEEGDFNYKEAVIKGYPALISHGNILISSGVKFRDLTQIFKNDRRTVYDDKCCHFNKDGYNAIAAAIIESIINYKK